MWSRQLRLAGVMAALVVGVASSASAAPPFVPVPGSPLARVGKYQGVALGHAPGQSLVYLARQDETGLLYLWRGKVLAAVPVTLPEPAGNEGGETGAAWADFNGDGHLDLFVSRQERPNLLYVNQGDNSFSEQGEAWQVDDGGRGQGVAWADYDGDGRLDLFQAVMGGANRLYRNAGASFIATRAEGSVSGALSLSGTWGDYDGDGDLDLYVVNHRQANELVVNQGGQLVVQPGASPLADAGPGISATWVDFDNDGDWDLSLSQYTAENRLLANDGASQPVFRDVARDVGLGDKGRGQQMAWGDYDLDGDLDVYVVNGGSEAVDLSRMFRNDDGRFRSVARELGLEEGGRGRALRSKGAVWWDMDADGDLDLYLVNSGEGTALFRNEVARGDNHWLAVELDAEGHANRYGVGGAVEVWSGGGVRQRQVGVEGGFLSQGSQTVHVGVGAEAPDSVVVVWPDGSRARHSKPVEGLHSFTREGPTLVLLDGAVELGSVIRGGNTRGTVRVANRGDTDAQIASVDVSPAELAAGRTPPVMVDPGPGALPVALAAGDTLAVVVGFAPRSEGGVSGQVRLGYGGGRSLAIPFSGRGVELPTLTVEPSGGVILTREGSGGRPTARVTLRNRGEADITITDCWIGRHGAPQRKHTEFSTEPLSLKGRVVSKSLSFTVRGKPDASNQTMGLLVVKYQPGNQQATREVRISLGDAYGYGSGGSGEGMAEKAAWLGGAAALFAAIFFLL